MDPHSGGVLVWWHLLWVDLTCMRDFCGLSCVALCGGCQGQRRDHHHLLHALVILFACSRLHRWVSASTVSVTYERLACCGGHARLAWCCLLQWQGTRPADEIACAHQVLALLLAGQLQYASSDLLAAKQVGLKDLMVGPEDACNCMASPAHACNRMAADLARECFPSQHMAMLDGHTYA